MSTKQELEFENEQLKNKLKRQKDFVIELYNEVESHKMTPFEAFYQLAGYFQAGE